MTLTVLFGFIDSRFLSAFHLEFVGILIDDFKDRFRDLLLPAFGNHEWEVFVKFLIGISQLETIHFSKLTCGEKS